VQSDVFIRKALKDKPGTSFTDIVGPNDIAYVIAIFKNGKNMWDQVIGHIVDIVALGGKES